MQNGREAFQRTSCRVSFPFEWGCYDNDHTAYQILEADSHEEAMLTVPPLFRNKTRVVKLVHFNPKKAEDVTHEK